MRSHRTRLIIISIIAVWFLAMTYFIVNTIRKNYLDSQLHSAIEYSGGDPKDVKGYLDAGADIESRDYRGDTPLLEAVGYVHVKIVDLLLERKANVNAVNNTGITPLINAAMIGQPSIVQNLLAHGANIHAKDMEGKTPLMWAVENSKTDRQLDPQNQWHDDFPATISLLKRAELGGVAKGN